MANTGNDKDEKKRTILDTAFFKRREKNVDDIIDQASLTMYGTTTKSNTDEKIKKSFHDLMKEELRSVNNSHEGYSSFISEILSHDNKKNTNIFTELNSSTDDFISSMQTYMYEAYRNRLLEQHDIYELSTQVVELQSAIEITKDAIISANVAEGRMNRTLSFQNIKSNDDNVRAIVENMEKKFDLQNKIKNFIVPNTLTYGEYYMYLIPYSELFKMYQDQNERDHYGRFAESTITEGFEKPSKMPKILRGKKKEENIDDIDSFLEKVYNEAVFKDTPENRKKDGVILEAGTKPSEREEFKKEFKEDMKQIMDNITVSSEMCPLPLLEEGEAVLEYLQYMQNSDRNNPFEAITEASTNKRYSFDDIPDCYLSLLEPTKVIPMKIMNSVIGYCVVVDETINPISGVISNNLYSTTFNGNSSQATIIDALADRAVKSFNKPFLKKNIKFKEAIVDCFRYYNLNERKIRFQFIPSEYIVPFKINRDINDNGTSMLKNSLLWGKLYLMLLLFKIMSIILYSNDQKVTYLRNSGINKDVANQVQRTIRTLQSRQINIADLFSYTTILNKVGNGNWMVVPTGTQGERALETEILSGQDIQLNTELMDYLKNNMILGTGVPVGILNLMHESDYARTIDENHSKFNAKVINYQLDFNEGITEMYKRLMKWSTNISEDVIDSFTFILQPPRSNAGSAKAELINNHQASKDYIISLYFPDPNESENPDELKEIIRKFSLKFSKSELQMFNYDLIEEFIEEAKIEAEEESHKPNPQNGDNGDDDGFDDALMNANI